MPADLKELRRLHEAATPGPWFKYMRTVTVEENGWDVEVAECSNNARGTVEADAALIAAARNALPELLDRLEAAEAEVARLKVALCKIQDEADFYSDAVAYTYVFEKIEKIAREAKG